MWLNNYFNGGRFARLFKQDVRINKTKYLLVFVGLGVLTYVLSYWVFNVSKNIQYEGKIPGNYKTCFLFYMMAVGVVVGTAFPDLTNQIKTSHYLLCPGSALEKYLVQFFIRIVLFIPMALGIFWIAIRLAKASLLPDPSVGFDPASIPYFEFRFLITNYDNEWGIYQILIFVFGFFSYGIFLFAGTTYFKRFALIKTVISSAILLGIFILFMMGLSHVFYPEKTHGFNITLDDFPVTAHLNSDEMFVLLFALLSWLFFLAFGYFKLKEKEV